ncbi:MAG: transcriptional regulator of the Arc/MetJ class [Candidatus Raymondbacteria bacterium RifOxyC12_full_50_8]|uniref:Transcriptional regulator of the Arc/MetJ class n=1 Tax=Candidatus Raymondbacteria bacterium RIFOXYD12_FULL_49_13 TaxID=1817890 RepID=A0A1F7F0C0_UNCRA|nr:MAG: transcriptional regulator of the Arc/MetJ class [Candidatus Raymondbacteria bacterium RIFOXYA2_FULL_49_16]OGK00052.1 MAG: transcriptional regulator of the Arc/MetJ class [Candidatus Raymondbacteria bacterium RIFOXYD12_FULL_49_13]OGK01342.1 MAG: transcriptional regulator of the Arc/MetJ class [Candidatus Raymondbacteria bacterium RifOxyC12_full_50_8]OGK03669.1 MAG: transcriptional regulator of the Arc/MetJ class [Candidatus Raymondbacteria bacterium RifOxyB12_full_50_8]OGP45041.1 MAG: tr
MKRTNIVIDENLVKRGLRATGLKTRRALVDFALQEVVKRERVKDLIALRGAIHWDGDLSRMRRSRIAQ